MGWQFSYHQGKIDQIIQYSSHPKRIKPHDYICEGIPSVCEGWTLSARAFVLNGLPYYMYGSANQRMGIRPPFHFFVAFILVRIGPEPLKGRRFPLKAETPNLVVQPSKIDFFTSLALNSKKREKFEKEIWKEKLTKNHANWKLNPLSQCIVAQIACFVPSDIISSPNPQKPKDEIAGTE